MNHIKVIDTNGVSKSIEYTDGDSLMEVLREADFEEIVAMCGGCCSCATCHVHITEQQKFALPDVEEDEERLLEMTDAYDQVRSRLSCQITLESAQNGLTVSVIEPE